VAAVALVVGIAACGGDDEAEPAASGAPTAAEPLLVMPIGDSITAGPYYRLPLARAAAADEQCHVDFVGSFTGVGDVDLDLTGLDLDHQAAGGATSDQIVTFVGEALREITPDVALVYVGTNDFYNEVDRDATIENLEALIERLRSANPRVRVLLAEIMPAIGVEDGVAALNARIAEIGDRLDSSASAVEVLDFATDVDVEADLIDGVHPNRRRSAAMADIWAGALAPLAGEGCRL
jgi:lysophospholipase L1-like esterase